MSEEKEMGFLDHLEELRWRLVKAAAAILTFGILAFCYPEILFDGIILAPQRPDFISYRVLCKFGHLLNMGDDFCFKSLGFSLQSNTMSGQLGTHMMVSAIAGIIISFPFIIYQLWGFIKPGLKSTEQKLASGVVFWISFLFLLGVLFGYFVLTPMSIQFLGPYQISKSVSNIVTLDSFISTVTSMTLYTGLVFELPILIYFLAKLGIISAAFLKKYRKHAFVVVLILAAIITPPDVISQCIVTIPLMLLYEISIVIAGRIEKTRPVES